MEDPRDPHLPAGRRRARTPAPTASFAATELDRRVLAFAAEHRVVLPGHVALLLGCSLSAGAWRLARLAKHGLMTRDIDYHHIKAKGLRTIVSRYRAPKADRSELEHDAGLAWVALAARAGAYGPVAEIVSERRMRSADAAADRAAAAGEPAAALNRERYGVRRGGYGVGGRERRHYPDLLLITPQGHRIAIELELSGKERRRREVILGAYGADPRIDAVIYLCDKPATAAAVRTSARRLGIAKLVHTQRLRWGENALPRTSAVARAAGRVPERGSARDEAS